MPYKHIAAHLKKTELACRLHYHQLSHGSNRRKRTTSVSSGSSTGGHSPTVQTSVPSPIHERDDTPSRSVSPPVSAGSYTTSPNGIQLPSIMTAANSTNTSPRLPAILPKPPSMNLALVTLGISSGSSAVTSSPTASRGYPTPGLHDHSHPHSARSMTPSGYRGVATPTSAVAPPHSARSSSGAQHHHNAPGPLRLDCSALPPPPSSASHHHFPTSASHPVDMGRLGAIYNAHRASFWAAVAADYGSGANPLVLERAWRGTPTSAVTSASGYSGQSLGIAAHTPITPVGSPDDALYTTSGSGQCGKPADKTRISAILGIDASPRSPREREMVRRLEEERSCVIGGVGA